MLRKILPVLFCILLASRLGFSQEIFDLKQCIDYAIDHNTQLLKAKYDMQQASNSYIQSRANVLPTLNGNATNNFDFGRTIDPATNQFSNESSRTNYFTINGDWIIYGGLQKLNQVREYEWSKDASIQNVQKVMDDVSLTVANYYLQILLLNEKRGQMENLVKSSDENQKKVNILFEARGTTLAKKYEADAQLATDQYNLVDIENQLTKQYLALKQYMNFDMTKELKVKEINFQGQIQVYKEEDVAKAINERVAQLPAVKAARSTRESALYAWKAMKGTAVPKLSVDASLHSIYSTQYMTYGISGYQPIGILGLDPTKIVYGPRLSEQPVSFNDQLSQNFGQTIGFTLNIPIFNGLQTKYNIQAAHITYQSDDLLLTDAEVKAKNDIYTAFESMNGAKKKFDAGTIKFQSQEALFKTSEINYNAGAMTFFDYSTARTSYMNAQSDLTQAKYEYIFQTKVFEYYLGKPVIF